MAKEGKRITAARQKVDKDQLYDAATAVAQTRGQHRGARRRALP